ncbi:MAG: hypothetical protein IT381_12535 [Deltaproteobacteria bacterium]|nr:hypothetical protein [Deltaproteobacteria bacterium]
MTTTKKYPLLFGFREPIFGRKFVAGVKLHGRAMAEDEGDDGWWIYGVTPGALTDTGSTLVEAMTAFRQRLKAVLVDYAAEATDFASFKVHVSAFLKAVDEDANQEWEAARKAVRAGKVDVEGLGLQRETAPGIPSFEVVELVLEPSANSLNADGSSLAA